MDCDECFACAPFHGLVRFANDVHDCGRHRQRVDHIFRKLRRYIGSPLTKQADFIARKAGEKLGLNPNIPLNSS